MALRYVVKKRMIGFGKEKTEKYVAQNFITNTVNFKDLCDEISKVGMVPSGAVKFVLDALIDTLNINLNKGISVQLGDFGQFRPGISSESQETEAAVDSDTIRRVKIVFTPRYKFKDMLKKASIQKLVTGSEIVDNGNTPTPPNPDGGGGGGGGVVTAAMRKHLTRQYNNRNKKSSA